MSKLETNTIDTVSGTANLTIGGANNTGSTTIKTNNTNAVTIDNSQNLQFNSGFGSVATVYGCRAWVNFNGQGTPAIRADGNVTSITDNGTGNYTVNFTTAMPDANYSLSGFVQDGAALTTVRIVNARAADIFSTTSKQVIFTTGSSNFDPLYGTIQFFR